MIETIKAPKSDARGETRGIALLAPERRFEDPALRTRVEQALGRVAFGGRWILGDEVEALEQAMQAQLGVRHSVAVKSGTDALLLALMALGVGRGDGVVTSVFSFFASASTIVRVGARPQFVDICPGCYCLDPAAAAAAVHANTRAILPVHLFGQPAEMTALLALAARAKLAVLEDCAQAQGARHQNRPVGSLGTLGSFSFFPSKNMSALGDGGLVSCNDDTLACALRELRNHGAKARYVHQSVGGNFRLDALQAALVCAQLPALDAWTQARCSHARIYNEIFAQADLAEATACTCTHASAPPTPSPASAAPLGPPSERTEGAHTYNQYVLRLRGAGLREHVARALQAKKMGCAIYYPTLLAEQPALAHVGARAESFQHAARAAAEVLALPIYAQLGADECTRVAEAVVDAVRSFRTRPRQSGAN